MSGDVAISNDVLEYIDRYWKPNQDDSLIIVAKGTDVHSELDIWFDDLNDPSVSPRSMDIGPFMGVKPYGKFDVEDDENKTEFLFTYDKIDNTKLKACHLTLV